MRFARCVKCLKWLPESKLVILGCPACFFQTARCHAKDCQGTQGAIRSVFSHFAYWRGRGNQDGGHTVKLTAWTNYTSAKERILALEAAEGR